ncbi:hypothetical protein [Pseudomonas sp. 2FE]|uniref:hypothetical protein n=1 Tax=Pseudomonas sp. 2FE TaxID=2502190 RepID=UPI0010F6587D|nr:hypothetical protein [Pseudomonas sp. 2FE]
MKKASAIIFSLMCAVNTAATQASPQFKYPSLIECTPVRAVGVRLFNGITEKNDLLSQVEHVFKYIQNGRYELKSGAVFVSKLTNQEDVLNLYSGSTTYSIDMYGGEYVGSTSHEAIILPDQQIVGGSASGTLFEGACKVNWN